MTDKINNTNNRGDLLLMCKDVPVYNVPNAQILNESLLPGAMLRGTLGYLAWMKTRYSVGSNATARRLMLRAFGTDNHNRTLSVTRALSLSDCYWLKQQDEAVTFGEVTPYYHTEWQGNGSFTGGSISTLFVNGAATKRWLGADSLLKEGSYKELEPYTLCAALGLNKYASKARMSDKGIIIENFTSTEHFLESFEQSGFIGDLDDARTKAVELFGERAVALFVVDYLVEHDDRHWGNLGFIRDANTGRYISMAPYYDFDWVWTDGVANLPDNAINEYGAFIIELCVRAMAVCENYERARIICKRADELIMKLK